MNDSPKTNWNRCRCLICLALAGLILAGCSVVSHETTETTSVIESLAGKGGRSGATNALAVQQLEVMREADDYVGGVAQAADSFRARVGTTEARAMAQQWKLNEATAAYINAAGDNPLLNAVDMVVLASLSSYAVEDYWVGEKYGEPARPLLQVQRQMESNAWRQVQGVLTPAQQQNLRQLLREYRDKNPHLRYAAAVRLPDLAASLGRDPAAEHSREPGNLFSLLYINPLAGLDPTTQAIEQTRLLAQRAMYYAQRAPTLLSWQVELTTYQLAAQPEARQVLSDVNDVAQSAKVFARTASDLPGLVNDQRQAAIQQLLDGLTSQQKQARQTLDAAGDAATNINAVIQSLIEFVRYVSPTNATPAPAATNSPPFNVLDYGTAAGQIGVAAEKLNTLLTTLNQTTPQLAQLGQQTSADANRVVDHAFRMGLVLILVLLAGLVAAGLTYRWLANKLAGDGNKPPAPKS
jgi:hypothetical protein